MPKRVVPFVLHLTTLALGSSRARAQPAVDQPFVAPPISRDAPGAVVRIPTLPELFTKNREAAPCRKLMVPPLATLLMRYSLVELLKPWNTPGTRVGVVVHQRAGVGRRRCRLCSAMQSRFARRPCC